METIFRLKPDEIKQAFEFARNIHYQKAQSQRDFGSSLQRQEQDFIADTAEGKLSELIFAKFAEKFVGIEISPDFDIYSDPMWIDYGQDADCIILNGQKVRNRNRFDIKATRRYSKWLLVESHKFWADAYILIKIDLPHDIEQNLKGFEANNIAGEVAGFVYHFDLIDPQSKKPWFLFLQGKNLFDPAVLGRIKISDRWTPDTLRTQLELLYRAGKINLIDVKLKSPKNYGFPIFWLRNSPEDWADFFNWMASAAIEVENQQVLRFLPR